MPVAISQEKEALLTPEQLHELLIADYETGKLYWRPRPEDSFATRRGFVNFKNIYEWKEAFTSNQGQMKYKGTAIMRNGKNYVYYAHRVIWAMYYGEWPSQYIDHINGDPQDNRIDNLRNVTHWENMQNRKPYAEWNRQAT